VLLGTPKSVLGIDLASRYSAAVLWDGSRVSAQFDSVGLNPGQFVAKVAEVAADHRVQEIVVEDIPHHVKWTGLVKKVCRLQGRILAQAEYAVWFVPPAVWQRSYDGVWRAGPGGASEAAAKLGYQAPDFSDDPRFEPLAKTPGERRRLRKKVESDYVDAYLIARWAANQPDLSQVPNVQRGDE